MGLSALFVFCEEHLGLSRSRRYLRGSVAVRVVDQEAGNKASAVSHLAVRERGGV